MFFCLPTGALVLLTFFLSSVTDVHPLFAAPPADPLFMQTVFIDPGHGGDDLGSIGPGGLLEKDVTLKLSRMIHDKLNGKYRIGLSRSGDYYMDIYDRSGLANESKARLFLSLHIGSGFHYDQTGFSIYFFELPSKADDSDRLSIESPPALIGDRGQWRTVQLKHLSDSQQVARFIRNRLEQVSVEPIVIESAGALVLEGVDMPAVLVEIGWIQNFSFEKKIDDIKYLDDVTEAISNAIDDYLNDKSGISSIDLRK